MPNEKDKTLSSLLTQDQIRLGLIANAIYQVWGTRLAKKMGRGRNQRKWPVVVVSDKARSELYPDSVNKDTSGYGYGRSGRDVDYWLNAPSATALLKADFFYVKREEYVMVNPLATKGDLFVGWCYFLFTRQEHWRPGAAYRTVNPWRKACEAALYSIKARYDHIDRALVLSTNNEGLKPWDRPNLLAPYLERLALLALPDALSPIAESPIATAEVHSNDQINSTIADNHISTKSDL